MLAAFADADELQEAGAIWIAILASRAISFQNPVIVAWPAL